VNHASNRRSAAANLAIAFLATACSAGGANDMAPDRGEAAPTLAEVANATYAGILQEQLTLEDGRWEGQPFIDGGAARPTVALAEHFLLEGDLDADGRPEAVALLWESSGGSGTRSYLAAMGRDDGRVVNLDTALIGDRVQLKSGSIAGGRITLELVEAGPADAACCPTQRTRSVWSLTGTGLERVAREVEGTLSLVDLAGPRWRLVELGTDEALTADLVITLAFEDGRAVGSGGCNRYFATVHSEAPGSLAFSATGTTMMACPEPVMEVESRYLATLSAASRYGFLAGRLVIGCDTAEGPVNLVFARSAEER
jgi:heat shock protein HslJ